MHVNSTQRRHCCFSIATLGRRTHHNSAVRRPTLPVVHIFPFLGYNIQTQHNVRNILKHLKWSSSRQQHDNDNSLFRDVGCKWIRIRTCTAVLSFGGEKKMYIWSPQWSRRCHFCTNIVQLVNKFVWLSNLIHFPVCNYYSQGLLSPVMFVSRRIHIIAERPLKFRPSPSEHVASWEQFIEFCQMYFC
jgi:hypothetical protein